jgi:hypothetical protein
VKDELGVPVGDCGAAPYFTFSDGYPITYYPIVAGTVNHIH